MRVVVPTDALLIAFDGTCWPIFEKWNSGLTSNDGLESTGNLLLPKLLSGQLAIPDAEKLVSGAT